MTPKSNVQAKPFESFEIAQPVEQRKVSFSWVTVMVPLILFASSLIMSMAWLGHLKFRSFSFGKAIFLAWLLVLPEYCLNILALRMGFGRFTAGLMGAWNVCTGVVCVALVSHYFLDETLGMQKLAGFALMIVALMLISKKKKPALTLVKE